LNLEQTQSLLQQALDLFQSKLNFALLILQEGQYNFTELDRKKAAKDLKILTNIIGNLDSAVVNVAKAIATLDKEELY